MKILNNTATENNDILSYGVGLKHVVVGGDLFNIRKKTKICGIYKITSPTGKIYIGQSRDFRVRKMYYERLACEGQTKLYHSLKKHGVDKHKIEIIHICNPEELDKLEIDYINTFQTFNSKNGLNLRGGGSNGIASEETRKKISNAKKNQSEETRKKISESKKGTKNYWHRDNNRFSESHLKKMSEAQKGRIFSEESKKKMSESRKGIVFSEQHKENLRLSHLGHKPTEETRKKLSETHKGEKNHWFGKGLPEEALKKLRGRKRSEEQRKKMSEAQKSRPIITEETRRKISESQKGRIFSEEHKKHLSESLKGDKSPNFGKKLPEETRRKMSEYRKLNPAWNKGKVLSEEHKRKLSEAHKGEKNHNFRKKQSNETIAKRVATRAATELRRNITPKKSKPPRKKTIVQKDKNGVVVNIFKSVSEASMQTGIIRTGISMALLKCNKTSGGYIWDYL